jgi:hypothetical protein
VFFAKAAAKAAAGAKKKKEKSAADNRSRRRAASAAGLAQEMAALRAEVAQMTALFEERRSHWSSSGSYGDSGWHSRLGVQRRTPWAARCGALLGASQRDGGGPRQSNWP